MAPLNERYLTDAEGNRIAVVLDMETYERLLDAAEELEDIQAYVAARARIADDELVPIEHLAEKVGMSDASRVSRRVKTEADYEAFRAAAGSWKDVDTDRLIEDIYESRRRSSRPPVEL